MGPRYITIVFFLFFFLSHGYNYYEGYDSVHVYPKAPKLMLLALGLPRTTTDKMDAPTFRTRSRRLKDEL
uniref:Putative secreted protein n=1 Tax=Ixodes ricinus TaxID=34613 RepID=A0A6B0U936_IXORI